MRKLLPVILFLIFSGCAVWTPAVPTPLPPTSAPPTPSATLTVTRTPLPTATPTPAIPTDTPTPTLTPTRSVRDISLCPPGAPAPEETRPYRMIYLRTGNLYLQDENQEPVLLRNSGTIRHFTHLPGSSTIFYIQVDHYGRDELWSMNLTGRTIKLAGPPWVDGQITTGPISSDGGRIAFSLITDDVNGEVWVANTDGSGTWRVVSAADLRALLDESFPPDTAVSATGLAWVPDSRILLYDVYPLVGDLFVYIPNLHSVNVATGQKVETRFTSPPYYSPNRQTAAITAPDGLTFTDADGRNPRTAAVDYFATGLGEVLYYPPMQWLPDSSAVLLAQIQRGDSAFPASPPVDIWHVPADGSPAQQLATFNNTQITAISFSPDLSLVHYQTDPFASNLHELHIARLPATPGQPVQDVIYDRQTLAKMMGWSANGRNFLYTAGEATSSKLMIGDLCGEPRQLATELLSLHTWIDSQRFVLRHSDETGLIFTYYIGNLNGEIYPLFPEPLDKPYLSIWVP